MNPAHTQTQFYNLLYLLHKDQSLLFLHFLHRTRKDDQPEYHFVQNMIAAYYQVIPLVI